MKKENRLQNGNIYTSILILAIPAMVTVILAQSSFLIDAIFVALYDTSNLPVMALSQPVTMFGAIIPFAIVAGVSPLISRKLGEGELEKTKQYFMSALVLTLIITIVYVSCMFIFNNTIFTNVLSIPSQIMTPSKNYLYPIIISQLFYTNVIIMEQASIAQGDTFKIMVVNIISVLINIVFNFIFLTQTELGLFGIGLSTLISAIFKFIVYGYLYSFGPQSIKFTNKVCFDYEFIHSLLSSSIAALGMSLLTLVAMLINNKFITMAEASTVLLTAKTMISILFSFCTSFMIGIMQTTQSFIAYNFGAKEYKRMKRSAATGLGYSLMFATVLSIILILNRESIANLFTLDVNASYFNIAIYATALSLYAMPITFLVTSFARSTRNNKVLFYHQWITNGLVIILVNIFFPFIFSEDVLPALRSVSQILMLFFVIPSYVVLFRNINKLERLSN